jgi:proteasome lid subunit RPN8/RPN11
MGLFRSPEVLGIAGDTLSFALNAAEETHPREYMGFLRTERASELGLDREGQVITDVLVVPGTVSDESSAQVNTLMKHNAPNAVGSVHSHPSGVLRPSATDRGTFRRGHIHIIIGRPYGWNDWQAFDGEGDPTDLDVLDVDLPEDDFFELTREALDHELDAGSTDDDGSGDDGGGLLSWFR